MFDFDGDEGEAQVKIWVLNLNEARDALAYMIIVDELTFRRIEKPSFRHFMSVCCPRLHIPSRIIVARDCFQLYLKERTKLKELLSMKCQGICVTTNTWTSIQRINYMCLIAHFIDTEWKLHKKILNFCLIFSHKGKAIAKAMEQRLGSWGVNDKLFIVTVDNASSNDVACSELKKMVQKKLTYISNESYLHMRCVTHIINLIVWDGLKKNKKYVDKVRYVVKFVKSSASRLKLFKDLVGKYVQSQLCLSLDVPTRWNYTFEMLETTLKYQDIFWMMDIPTNPQLDLDPKLERERG